MDQKMGMVVLAIICGIILLVLLLRKRAQIILNFLVRTVLGAIMILLVNDILQKQGFDIYVGLNPGYPFEHPGNPWIPWGCAPLWN